MVTKKQSDVRERVKKLIDKNLTPEQKRMFSMVSIENQRGIATFRMPKGVISLETVWGSVTKILDTEHIPYKRVNPFATLAELDDLLDNIKWLWPGWLPQGFNTMLVGDPGVGKSIVALEWVNRVIKGDPWPLEPKDAKRKQRPAIWIETEASQQLLKLRARAFGIDKEKLYLPVIDGDILGQPDISNESHREQILQLVESIEPGLVVLDSLGSSQPGGENRKEDIEPVLQYFAQMARDFDIAVLIVHHLRKMAPNENPEVSLGRVRGSSAISALCRSVIAITAPTDDVVKLSHVKANLAKKQKAIAVKMVEDENEDVTTIEYAIYTPPAPKKLKTELVAEWVMTQLQEGPVDLIELVKRAEPQGFTRNNLYNAKILLGDRIAAGGSGNHAIWSLSEVDEDAVQQLQTAVKANGKKG